MKLPGIYIFLVFCLKLEVKPGIRSRTLTRIYRSVVLFSAAASCCSSGSVIVSGTGSVSVKSDSLLESGIQFLSKKLDFAGNSYTNFSWKVGNKYEIRMEKFNIS